MMIETIAMWVVCFALGLLIGYEIGNHAKHKAVEAPTPVLPDYDVNNPINANGRRGETVEICGAEWTRM